MGDGGKRAPHRAGRRALAHAAVLQLPERATRRYVRSRSILNLDRPPPRTPPDVEDARFPRSHDLPPSRLARAALRLPASPVATVSGAT